MITLEEAIKRYDADKDNWFNNRQEDYVYELAKNFVNDYPIEKIKDIKLEDYLISKEGGSGKKDSYCRRLRFELDPLCHMGNVRFDVFGIYLNDGTVLTLSDTFKNIYGTDYQTAFEGIKDEIIKLLIDFGNDNYDGVNENKLNWSFKDKLLCVYYPDKYFPVCTSNVLKEYYERVGLALPKSMSRVLKNVSLVNYMEKHPVFAGVSHYKKMSFCDFLWRKELHTNLFNSDVVPTDDDENNNTKEVDLNIEVIHEIFGSGHIKLYTPTGILCVFDGGEKTFAYTAFVNRIKAVNISDQKYIEYLGALKEKNNKKFLELINEKMKPASQKEIKFDSVSVTDVSDLLIDSFNSNTLNVLKACDISFKRLNGSQSNEVAFLHFGRREFEISQHKGFNQISTRFIKYKNALEAIILKPVSEKKEASTDRTRFYADFDLDTDLNDIVQRLVINGYSETPQTLDFITKEINTVRN